MTTSFAQFIRERHYLHNVSPATIEWYKHSFKWLRTENPTEEELKDAVMRMREKGLKATGCNSAIRAINAYLKWSGSPQRLLYLKEDQRVLPTFRLPDQLPTKTDELLSAPTALPDSRSARHRLPDRRSAEPQIRRLRFRQSAVHSNRQGAQTAQDPILIRASPASLPIPS